MDKCVIVHIVTALVNYNLCLLNENIDKPVQIFVLHFAEYNEKIGMCVKTYTVFNHFFPHWENKIDSTRFELVSLTG